MNWKTVKSYFLAVDPCRRSQDPHAESSDEDSGTCDFKLGSSRLFYLCKVALYSIQNAPCPYFVRNGKLNLKR